jgi:uncharacterized protein YukE
MRSQKLVRTIVSLAFLGIVVAAFLNFQSIYDWYRLRNYQPTPAIAQLAKDTAMSEEGTRLFYVSYPELIPDKAAFRQKCTINEASIVLGCYVSRRGIYIYEIADKRLEGIEEVTAAHEMLHVGYERLSSSERQRVDALTAQAFSELKNQRVIDTVEQYREGDPSVVPNELHSILGTEVANLPTELEAYYARFFSDRKKVVDIAERYEKVFSAREAKIAVYDRQLEGLGAAIASAQQQIKGLNQDLAMQRERIDSLLADDNTAAYNAAVPAYNADVSRYNQLVETTREQISSYNQIVADRNDIAVEERELYEALDSRTIPESN